jgi:iron complex outermembrane receptor protein
LIRLSQPQFVTASPTSSDDYIYNGFVQDQVTILPNRLQWFVGSKLEYNNFTNLEWQPSTRLLWTPDDHNSVWGAISRSVRLPSVYQETNLDLGGIHVGTQDPDSEKSWSYEIGYKVQPAKTVTMSVTGFYNNYTDLIVPIPNLTVPFAEVDYGNAVNAHSYGGEFSTNWQVAPIWRLAASYSYAIVRAEDQNRTMADQFIPPYEVQEIAGSNPQNQFQIHSYLDVLKNVQFNTSLYYVDALRYINGTASGSGIQDVHAYFRLDANIRWQITQNMTFAIGVQNALQDRHLEFGNVSAQALATEVPRTFFAQWTMAF